MLVVFIEFVDNSIQCFENVKSVKYIEDKIYISTHETMNFYKLSSVISVRAYIE